MDTLSAVETESPVPIQFSTFCSNGVFAPSFFDAGVVKQNIYCGPSEAEDYFLRTQPKFQNGSALSKKYVHIRNPILCVERGEIVLFAVETSKCTEGNC